MRPGTCLRHELGETTLALLCAQMIGAVSAGYARIGPKDVSGNPVRFPGGPCQMTGAEFRR